MQDDEERDRRIETLTDAIADAHRAAAEAHRAAAGADARISRLAEQQEITGQRVALLADDIATLSRLMRQHLIVDHDYPTIEDDDA